MSAIVAEKVAPYCAIECILVTAKEEYLINCWRGSHGKFMQLAAISYVESRGIDTTALKKAYLSINEY